MKTHVLLAVLLAAAAVQGYPRSAAESGTLVTGVNGNWTYIGNYSTDSVNEDGGIAEIVQYNRDAKRIYVVNGDLGPEGICAVAAEDSPTRRSLIFTANEVSGTIAVFEVKWAA
jgi:hypothetical protein